jgi:hypothetical protein
MKTGTADLPLHYGKAPSCLFQMMKKLANEIIITITNELGHEEFSRKISCLSGFRCWAAHLYLTDIKRCYCSPYVGHYKRV